MRKKRIILVCIIMLFIALVAIGVVNFNSKKDINKILASDEYSYLPMEAKNYIKKVYEESGVVLLTEKNKEDGMPYLNPTYVSYLVEKEGKDVVVGNIPMATTVDYSLNKKYESAVLPSSYDLRNVDGKNFITPVRNQGDMGLCWAFSTAGVVESKLLKSNNVSYTSSAQLISERQLDYATAVDGINDYKSEYVSFVERRLGFGGNFYISTIAMANGITLNDYNAFKAYNDMDYSMMELKDVLNYNKALYEVNSTTIIPPTTLRESTGNLTANEESERTSYINQVKTSIMKNGAAYVGTFVDSCTYYEPGTNNLMIDVYNCKSDAGHAMQVIGWDDNKEFSYCADTLIHSANTTNCKKVVNGKGMWILKNSWGNNDQYPYLSYDSLGTDYGQITSISSKNEKNWDNNYVLGTELDVMQVSNYSLDIPEGTNEILRKVKFIVSSYGGEYTIKVKKNGVVVNSFSGSSLDPGLLTIESNEDILIDKDTVINISSSSTSAYIDKVSFFTSNQDNVPIVILDKYDNEDVSSPNFRFYSETRNINSDTVLTYKLFSGSEDVTSKMTVAYNVVAENNVNPLIRFSNELANGKYTLKVYNGNSFINQVSFNYKRMEGAGTLNNPYVITTSEHLDQIRNDLDAYYILGNDIDLTSDVKEDGKFYWDAGKGLGGHGWAPINGFTGSLDGKGYSIKGLITNTYLTDGYYYSKISGTYFGLFGTISENVEIKNLVLENFDINCYEENSCGTLFGGYKIAGNDYTEYHPKLSNIVVKNSNVSSLRDYNTYLGGLFGNIVVNDGTLDIENVYVEADVSGYGDKGMLGSNIFGAAVVNVKNIQLAGNIENKNTYDSAVFVHSLTGNEYYFENIISTVYNPNLSSNLIYKAGIYADYNLFGKAGKIFFKNIMALKTSSEKIFAIDITSDKYEINNVNFYDIDKLSNFVDSTKYNGFSDFSNNWVMKTIDGTKRMPILKAADSKFNYTSISDITINQQLNKKYNIFDYLNLKTFGGKKITFKSNSNSIVKIDENGYIISQGNGVGNIHVESLHDGYIKDVPVNITYLPHYIIHFDGNGGEGAMDSVEVNANQSYLLKSNTFTRLNYVFNGWNTKSDGTGTSYSNGSSVSGLSDKQEITLYAQWIGQEITLNFHLNGGNMDTTVKKVRYGEKYGVLPIPTKDGFGFNYWYVNVGIDVISIVKSVDVVKYNISDVYANWVSNAYTIVYNPNGGEGFVTSSYAYNGSNKSLDTNPYTRSGYKFIGWNTKNDGTGISYEDNAIINLSNVSNSKLTLYAQWEKEITNYKVTLNSNNGSGTTLEYNFPSGESKKIPKNTFVYNGYEFIGWNTKADGTGTNYSDEEEVNFGKDTILYAKWKEAFKYQINYPIDDNKKFIDEIAVLTTIAKYREKIQTGTSYRVEIENGENEYIATGSKTKIYKNNVLIDSFTNIVRGEVTGDGEIDYLDYVYVYNHIYKTKNPYSDRSLLIDEFLVAGDMSKDSEIDYLDYVLVYNKIKELKGGNN